MKRQFKIWCEGRFTYRQGWKTVDAENEEDAITVAKKVYPFCNVLEVIEI